MIKPRLHLLIYVLALLKFELNQKMTFICDIFFFSCSISQFKDKLGLNLPLTLKYLRCGVWSISTVREKFFVKSFAWSVVVSDTHDTGNPREVVESGI